MSFIMVGNKNDMEDQRKVSTEEAQALAEENGMVYLETSAKTGENVEKLFTNLAEIIL